MPNLVSPLELWTPEALKLPSDDLRLSVPFHVHLGEAADVARFHARFFASVPASEGSPGRPGLDTVVNEQRGLTASTGADILSLLEATQRQHTTYLLLVSPATAAPMQEGRFTVDEISATLEYFFDDGVEDERDAQLHAVEAATADAPESIDAMASELEAYAALGNLYRNEIDGLGGFAVKLLDRAVELAADLRSRPPVPENLSEEARKARALRNRLATLLLGRMNAVRSAARFVFRHHPEIVRQVTSAYERRRRAAARRNALKKGPKEPA